MDNDVRRDLERDARHRQERIPMAVDKKVALDVALRLRELIGTMGITQGRMAKMMGVGEAKLSLFLRDQYKARAGIEEMVNKGLNLLDSMGRKARREKQKPFIKTTIANSIGALITQTEVLSDEEGKIGLVVGDGGHGKSICLREYAKANRNSVYVELDDAMTSTTMFGSICQAVGIDSWGSLSAVTQRLIQNLVFRHVIIMLDEASGLSVKKLNQLRQIIVVKAKCPLVLAGNSDLYKTVMQEKTKRGCESLDQFTSRLSYILNLDEQADEPDCGLYTADDIRNLYQYGGLKLTNDAVTLLKKICRTSRSGRLRTCSHVVATLHTSKRCRRLGQIDAAAIISAIEQLGLPVRIWLPVHTGDLAAEEQSQTQQVKTAG